LLEDLLVSLNQIICYIAKCKQGSDSGVEAT